LSVGIRRGVGCWKFLFLMEIPVVMRELDPRIHPLQKMMDCRVKPGNDVPGIKPGMTDQIQCIAIYGRRSMSMLMKSPR